MLTNPPPSSGGILIADALGILERLERPHRPGVDRRGDRDAPTGRATRSSSPGFGQEGYLERFLAQGRARQRGDARCARGWATPRTSPCSTPRATAPRSPARTARARAWSCPAPAMHLNNMLGEEDLNPLGYHRHEPGARVPSMMAPTVVLRDGEPEVALGSAGSNRIRSAILQTILGVVDHGPAGRGGGGPRRAPRGGRRGGGRAGRRPRPRWRQLEQERAGRCGAGPREPLLRRRAGGGAQPRDRRAERRRRPPARRVRRGCAASTL